MDERVDKEKNIFIKRKRRNKEIRERETYKKKLSGSLPWKPSDPASIKGVQLLKTPSTGWRKRREGVKREGGKQGRGRRGESGEVAGWMGR